MRTLAICFTICLVAFLAVTEYRRSEDRKIQLAEAIAKSIVDAAAAEKKAAAEQPRVRPVASSREWTYMPGLGRYIEHDRGTSAMQSIGGGGGGAPKPAPQATDAGIKKAWGFGKTTLDEPVRR